MTDTTRLGITHLASNQASPEVVVNQALDDLDRYHSDRFTHNMASDANYTLSGLTDPQEFDHTWIRITDTSVNLTTERDIIIPNTERVYFFENATLQVLRFKTSSGSAANSERLGPGSAFWCYCDGSNVLTRFPEEAPHALTLSADATIAIQDPRVLWIDPNGANRNVDLPAEEQGLRWEIWHSGTANTLTIREDSGTTTITTLITGEACILRCNGTIWRALKA